MAQKNRKIVKQRGSRNCGRGRKGSRKKASGRGMAGTHKHKYTWVVKYAPDYFGKVGMPRPTREKKPKTVNIGYLNQYAEKNKLKEIDLEELGFGKVLGGGGLKIPLTVKGARFTKKAKQKIEAAGGKVIETRAARAPEARKQAETVSK